MKRELSDYFNRQLYEVAVGGKTHEKRKKKVLYEKFLMAAQWRGRKP